MAKRVTKSPLTWGYDFYIPSELQRLPEKEVRREYTKLRDILRKRYERLAARPEYKNMSEVKEYKNSGGIKKLSDIQDRKELNERLTWLAWDIEEGLSISRIEEEKKKRDEIFEQFAGEDDRDFGDLTEEEQEEVKARYEDEKGKFWQWLKGKYDNAYLPPSDIVDEAIDDIMSNKSSTQSRKIVFGQWRANKRREAEYKIVRA